MVTNSNFNFITQTNITLELPFSEHIEELRQRLFLLFGTILLLTSLAFFEVKITCLSNPNFQPPLSKTKVAKIASVGLIISLKTK